MPDGGIWLNRDKAPGDANLTKELREWSLKKGQTEIILEESSSEEESEDEDEDFVEYLKERLTEKIGDNRKIVNTLIHKFDPIPMSRIKALPDKKAISKLATLMCCEEDDD